MTNHFDALLALGCGIDETGQLTGDAKMNVEVAAKLFKRQIAPLLIFSGGYSYKADFIPPIGESQAMKDYAISLGVPDEKILVETKSKDTLGNAYFTKVQILGPMALRHIGILRGPNQSEERVRYIFSKVLGGQYDYEILQRDEDRPEEQERERKSLIVIQNWLKDVEDGDETSVYQIMREKHPAYSTDLNAQKSLERELDNA